MKQMSENTTSAILCPLEIEHVKRTPGLQDTAGCTQCLAFFCTRQVIEHERREDAVEVGLGARKSISECLVELDGKPLGVMLCASRGPTPWSLGRCQLSGDPDGAAGSVWLECRTASYIEHAIVPESFAQYCPEHADPAAWTIPSQSPSRTARSSAQIR
jgi:hypothetical protein